MRLLLALFAAGLPGQTLHDQAVARALATQFDAPEVSYLLLSAGSKEIVAVKDLRGSVALGSLVKPILLLAYGPHPPELRCDASRCWRPGGHGLVKASRALAHSCNSYFEQLASSLSRDAVTAVATRLGVEGPPDAETRTLIGASGRWRISPLAAARAYIELAKEPMIRSGLLEASRSGTALLLRAEAAAKTGTAPCAHGNAPGDGFAIAVTGRHALLVRVHGTTGARAAATAGRMLRLLSTLAEPRAQSAHAARPW